MSLIDIHSDTWATVKAVCEALIEGARRNLERPGADMARTEHERGRITAARAILELAADPVAKPEMPKPYTY